MNAPFRPLAGASLGLSLLFAALPASTLAAQTAQEEAATKALLASQKAALKQFRTELSATSKTLVADLTLIEQTLKAGADGDSQAELLFEKLVELQKASTSLATTAADAQATTAKEQLGALQPAVEGQYPAAFYPGDGSPTASFEAGIDKELAKVYGKLVKRIAKTVARFEQSGTLLTVRLRAPERPARTWSTTFVDYFLAPTVSIDVALAWSEAGTAGSGRLRIAGRAQNLTGFEEDVAVTATATALDDASLFVPAVDERYEAAVSSDLLEGVYLLGVTQGSLAPAALTIGLR
jgi:hypothetical protein